MLLFIITAVIIMKEAAVALTAVKRLDTLSGPHKFEHEINIAKF